MKYQVYDFRTQEVYFESPFQYEAEQVAMDYPEAMVIELHECRGCQTTECYEQHDAHGITTGYWCDECYDSDKYPYRKDAYPTIETHGYGERLSDDY